MAKKADARTYDVPPVVLVQAAVCAVGELGYTMTQSNAEAGTLSFNTGRSWKSWAGQDMTATVVSAGQGSKLLVGGSLATRGIRSGAVPNLAAWGEKKQVTEPFFAKVNEILPDIPSPQPESNGDAYLSDQLGRLVELHNQGALTDDEFASAKSRLLAG